MKKIILVATVFLSALFISCGSDDDGGSGITQDLIIGKWKLEQTFTDNVSDNISNCEKESIIEYKADGSYSGTDKLAPNSGTTCNEDSYSGTWKNKGNNKYSDLSTGETVPVEFTITFPEGKLTRVFENEKEVFVKIN
jgi:major membrane immunogen (membrane-anchored lipoprotein)